MPTTAMTYGFAYLIDEDSALDDGDSVELSGKTNGTDYCRVAIVGQVRKGIDFKREAIDMMEGNVVDASLGKCSTIVEIRGRETSRTQVQAMEQFCFTHKSLSGSRCYLYIPWASNDFEKFYRPTSAAMKEYLECAVTRLETNWDNENQYYDIVMVVRSNWTE